VIRELTIGCTPVLFAEVHSQRKRVKNFDGKMRKEEQTVATANYEYRIAGKRSRSNNIGPKAPPVRSHKMRNNFNSNPNLNHGQKQKRLS
jgi:hypothetical protein